MNRTEKKCFIASTGFHLLLILILFIGPAFLSTKQPQDITIDFIPSRLVDAAVAGGGSPLARPPAAPQQIKQPTPAIQPPPEPSKPKVEAPKPIIKETKAPEPEPEKVVKDTRPDPDALESTPDKKPRKPVASLKTVVRGQTDKSKPRAKDAAAEREAKELADSRAAAKRALQSAAASLRSSSASATVVDDEFGPGGGGPVYASYAAWVKKVYEDAWEEPADASKDDAVAKATVTIAQDGTILNARITTSSGDSQVDASVRRTLERVKTIGLPFPEGIKEKQRTYIINFNLKAKRLIG